MEGGTSEREGRREWAELRSLWMEKTGESEKERGGGGVYDQMLPRILKL